MSLPSEHELQHMFDRLNDCWWEGKIPRYRVEWSTRMRSRSAGNFNRHKRVLRLSHFYHQRHPEEIEDTLKHEMIHAYLHHSNTGTWGEVYRGHHGPAFKAEAKRVGAAVRARHPLPKEPFRWLYACPNGHLTFNRRRDDRRSCGRCSTRYDPRFSLYGVKLPQPLPSTKSSSTGNAPEGLTTNEWERLKAEAIAGARRISSKWT